MSRSVPVFNELHNRHAVPADALEMADVHIECWRETYAELMPARVLAMLDVEARRHMWRKTIKHKACDTLLCVDENDAVAGFVCGGPPRAVPNTYDGEVRAIYLLQAVQGRGMGRSLMRAIAEAMTARGCRSAALRVARDTANARAFYEHLGGIGAGKASHKVDDFNIVTTVYGWPDISVLL